MRTPWVEGDVHQNAGAVYQIDKHVHFTRMSRMALRTSASSESCASQPPVQGPSKTFFFSSSVLLSSLEWSDTNVHAP